MAIAIFFWITVAAMMAAYVTAPAFKIIYSRLIWHWYRAAAAQALHRPSAAAMADRHARQAILTRQTLPDGGAGWRDGWNQALLTRQQAELTRLMQSKASSGAPLRIDISGILKADGIRLIESKESGDAGRRHRVEIKDNFQLQVRLSQSISPLEFRSLVFEMIPVEDSRDAPMCFGDNYCQVIWLAEGVQPPYREEQSAIIPLGPGCAQNDGVTLDLSRRYDWLACPRVSQFILVFRLAAPAQFDILSFP